MGGPESPEIAATGPRHPREYYYYYYHHYHYCHINKAHSNMNIGSNIIDVNNTIGARLTSHGIGIPLKWDSENGDRTNVATLK